MSKEQFMKDVQAVLNQVRIALQQDGGDIELLDVNEETGEVLCQLQGTCAGCPYSQYTLTNYVEKTLKERVPKVTKVVNKNLEQMNI